LRAAPGLRLNEHIEADGPTVFAHACKMGLEGIVSKRKTSPYRSGRSPDWIKRRIGGSRRRITLGEHQRRRAEPRICPVHLLWVRPTIAVNFIATRVPNRATRPYLPRSSSALVMRRQSPANLSRQMATGFGFDGCRIGTVVGIVPFEAKGVRVGKRASSGRGRSIDGWTKGAGG
jgi:hypothetical protein